MGGDDGRSNDAGDLVVSIIVYLDLLTFFLLFICIYYRRRHSLRAVFRTAGMLRPSLPPLGTLDPGVPPAVDALDPNILRSIPVVVVRGGESGGGAEECVVCLCDFEEGERLRVLPRCGHRFHAPCIDRWFREHATCPLCRAVVVAATPSARTTYLLLEEEDEEPDLELGEGAGGTSRPPAAAAFLGLRIR